MGFNYCLCVITGRCWGIGVQEWSIAWESFGPGVALGIGVDVGVSLHFLRKRRFLSVILPDVPTLIQYCRSGKAMMIFPIVFHLWLSGLLIATVSPARNGGRLWVYLLYLSTIFALRWWRISSQRCAATTHSGVACRGLTVQEWNPRVDDGVGVAPVIGQYFGLGCFGTAR